MPFTPPGSSREGLALLHGKLAGIGLVPPLVVAGFPASVRNNEHLDKGLSDGPQNGAQIVEQVNVAGDLFHHRPELAAFGQKVVVGIDQKQSGTCGVVVIRHANVATKRLQNKEPQDPFGTWGSSTLAMSYSRTTYRCTTIGAAAFHFRVRNGNGWCHCARITRRLVKPKLARGGRGRSRFNFTRNSSDLG